MALAIPVNTTAEVLYVIITKGSASIEEFSWMAGFRTRISELNNKHLIPLLNTREKGRNKHGNQIWYKRHSLPIGDQNFALSVYDKINKTK
jgi:hypothetical protein